MNWTDLVWMYGAGFASSIVLAFACWHYVNRMRDELPKLEILKSVEGLREEHERLTLELEEMRQRLTEANLTIEAAEDQRHWMDQVREEKEHLEAVHQDFQRTSEELARKREELTEVLENVRKEESRQAHLRAELEQFGKAAEEARELSDKLPTLREEWQHLHTQRDQAQRELSELRGHLEKEKSELDQITSRRSGLAAEVESLRAEKEGLEKTIERLADDRRREWEAAPPGSSGADRNAALWERVLDPARAESVPKKRDEIELLGIVQDHLRNRGLRFSERVLRAFHTSLKVADESPLLVLAGISGTGKSLLPRAYADALGLYFLNVAVQPGWDSPFDLTGFFSHVESRFKPTQLTRALLQMDEHFDPSDWNPGEAFQPIDDSLLLVLLDEMNLARVEYYFSDFLSRLEIRRDINPNEPDQRDRASLRLQVGRSESDENGHSELLVYPGRNVLFVGTMNEDESTQTLSDKVIDRANVMRFGRPATLATSRRSEDKVERSDRLVCYSDWKKWSKGRTLNSDENEKVSKWTRMANDALSTIGRPFGHRTARAIRAYAERYPVFDDSESALRHAMADQVEQKVLPKLRGVDPEEESGSESIGKIRQLVRELGDDRLANQVEEGCRHGHAFVWQGVDRSEDDD